MAYIIVWSILWIFLLGVEITLCMLAAGLYFYKGKQKEATDEKVMLYGFACLLLFGFGITQTLWIIAMMQYPGTYKNYEFYVNTYYIAHPPFMVNFILGIWALVYVIGFTLFIYAFERVVKRTRYLLTTICIALIILLLITSIFLSFEVAAFIYGFTSPILGLTALIILIIYTRWSRLEGKAVACFFYLWFALSGLAPIYHNLGFYYSSGKIISGILWILAILMSLVPLIINPRYLSQALRYWRISGVSITILYFITWIVVFFIYKNPTNPFNNVRLSGDTIVTGIVYVFFYFFIARSIKYEKFLEQKEEISRGFGAFVRPQRITEEEVSVSKEKKICLVCKGKILRFNSYICECNALYCEKCARTLIDLENACWACNAPIDPSKAVKPFKIEEEKIEISETPLKKPKKIK